jgi:hypothetical protein
MSVLSESRATLRIAGDDLDPAEVTRLLGAEPTMSQTKGEELHFESRMRIAKCGLWRLQAEVAKPEDINGQVATLLGCLSKDLAIWQELSQKFNIDLFCGWFMVESNEGITISVSTLCALAARGIEIDVDLYAPSTDS